MKQPEELFSTVAQILPAGGKLILTTPHPLGRKIHDIGARFGFFSKAASEEHEKFLNKDDMVKIAQATGFSLLHYKRFLFGVNQVGVFEKN